MQAARRHRKPRTSTISPILITRTTITTTTRKVAIITLRTIIRAYFPPTRSFPAPSPLPPTANTSTTIAIARVSRGEGLDRASAPCNRAPGVTGRVAPAESHPTAPGQSGDGAWQTLALATKLPEVLRALGKVLGRRGLWLGNEGERVCLEGLQVGGESARS